MKVHRRIRKQIRREGDGVNLAADVNVVFEGNLGTRRAPSSEEDAADRRKDAEVSRDAGARDHDEGGEQHG